MTTTPCLSPAAQSVLSVFGYTVDRYNTCSLKDLRFATTHLNRADTDSAITELRRAGVLSATSPDRSWTCDDEATCYCCPVSGEKFTFLHRANGL